jgi:hypothetical protein
MKLMAFDRLSHRRLLRSLGVAVFAIIQSSPILAQTAAMPAVTNAPDPRDAEAQRRLNLSHRRRAQEAVESAQNDLLLTASQDAQVADTAPRRQQHRKVTMHRATTPLGRRAMRPVAAAPGAGP